MYRVQNAHERDAYPEHERNSPEELDVPVVNDLIDQETDNQRRKHREQSLDRQTQVQRDEAELIFSGKSPNHPQLVPVTHLRHITFPPSPSDGPAVSLHQ
ncbi:hypothetical protein D3C73_1452090 [compost metagenome]